MIAAVALSSTVESVRETVKGEGLEYPVYLGGPEVGRALMVQQFPTTYGIGPDGHIVDRDTGWSPGWRLRGMVD